MSEEALGPRRPRDVRRHPLDGGRGPWGPTSAFLLLLAASSLHAEEVIDLGGGEAAPEARAPRASLPELWQKREKALEEGRFQEAESTWNDFTSAVGFLGISRAEPFALLELKRGIELVRSGDHQQAEACFDRALKLDPELWSVHHARAAAAMRRSVLALPSALMHIVKAWSSRIESEEARYFLSLQAALVAAGASGIVAFLLAVAALCKHGALLRHDVKEFFAGSFTHEFTELLGWTVLILPLLAWLGLFWATLYWLVTLCVYMGARERVVAFLGMGLAGACPLLQEVALYRAVPVITRPAPALLTASWGLSSVGARLGELAQPLGESPDAEARRLYAYALRDAGRTEEARAILEALNAEAPGNERVLLDIGNLHFVTGNDLLAIHYYDKATRANASYTLAYYNMSLAYSRALRLEDAESVKRKAEALDPELVARATDRGVAVLDDRPTFAGILTILHRQLSEDGYRAVRAKRGLLAAILDPFAVAALLAIGLAAGHLAWRRERHAERCERCGQPYCEQCKSESESPTYCAACLHLFVKREGISEDARTQKEAAIARRRRLERGLRVAMALLAPGLAQIHADRALAGAFLLVLSGAAAASWALGQVFTEPLQSLGRSVSSGVVSSLLLIGTAWLSGLYLTWKDLGSEEE